MSAHKQMPKYYALTTDIRKQLPYLWRFVGMFVLTVIFALGFQNEIVRLTMLIVSCGYPLIIIICLLNSIPRLNYYQIDSKAIHITILGIFHKHIYWSDIETIGPATIGNVEGIGMMYIDSLNHHVWGRKTRLKMWGWDEIVANAQTKDGLSFAEEISKQFKKHLRSTTK